MKHYFSFILILAVILLSCSKKSDDGGGVTPPPTVVHTDTLSAGWSKLSIDAFGGLVDIVAQNNTTGYAVGGYMYKTMDGGNTWNKVNAYLGTSATNLAVTPDGKVFVTNGTNIITRSGDGGNTFSTVNTGSGNVYDIYFVDNNTGYSLTSAGLIVTTNGGLNWAPVTPVTGLSINSGTYNSGWFFTASSGLVTNGADIYKSNGNVNSWTKSVFPGVAFTNATVSLYAVSTSVIYAAFSNGKICQSTDGGTTFNLKNTIAVQGAYFMDVHFTDVNTGYVSYGNRIYKTTDGGSNWQVVVALGSSTVSEIHFIDAMHGWACTDKGEIVKLN